MSEPRRRRSVWTMAKGTRRYLLERRVRVIVHGAVRRRNWTQAKIWLGWFR